MGVNKLTIFLAAFLMLLGYSYYEYSTAGPKAHPGYHYFIGKDHLQSHEDGPSMTMINLQHNGTESEIMSQLEELENNLPLEMEIQLKNGKRIKE